MDMRYRRLGGSGLAVSVVGIGCNNFGRKIDSASSRAVVDAALEHGVNFFDTADVYGAQPGASEEALGAALLGRRDDVVIATKFGNDMRGTNGPELGARGSRRYIMRAVEASLRRLRTDYIDLYQMHVPDPATPIEETLSTLDDLVSCLRAMGEDEPRELANLLLDTAEMPLALLFFGAPPPSTLGNDAALTVITMAGLRLPDLKIEREYWSAEEALALPMLHTAHRLAVRRCYGGSMSQRKLVGLDEAHFMEGWRSGRSFLVRLARDSRKWNLAALVASQNPGDILGLDVQNLVSTVFVGRIAEDSEIASEALRLLRVPTEAGYEQTLASLSAVDTSSASRLGFREFVMRDVDGRVQRVRVDVSYVPELLTHLDTTPAMDPAANTTDLTDPLLDEPEA